MTRQLFESHPRIGYRFIPGIKARVPHEAGGYLLKTNDVGFRCGRDASPKRGAGRRRVLVFGDSFTAGDGVSNGKRYSDLLELRLPDLDVLNFGLPGSGTDQQYLAYEEYARDLEHDVLVISPLVENIRRVNSRYRYFKDAGGRKLMAKPYYELVSGKLELRNVPVSALPLKEEDLPEGEGAKIDRGGRFHGLRQAATKLGLKAAAQRLLRYQPVPEYDRPDGPAWMLMRAILERWIREHNEPVILMPLPLYQHVEGTSDPSAYQARFRELAADTSCLLHDPLPDLRTYSSKERRAFRFPKDIHPTSALHQAIASSLAPALAGVLAESE
jgi:hypothetical protein